MNCNEKVCKEAVDAVTVKTEVEDGASNNVEITMDLKDMISSVFIAVFGLYVFFSGIHISVISQKMSDTAWYGTPGILPIIIGFVLTSLSLIMFISAYRKGERLNKGLIGKATEYFKSSSFKRLVVAIGFLAIYIFVLFRRIPFIASTFLYLLANMIYFRENDFAIWKLVAISAAFTVFLFFFFGQVAGVPLP